MLKLGRRIGRLLGDFLTPPTCPVSGERVSAPGLISAQAFAQLHFIDAPCCAQCGRPFAADYAAPNIASVRSANAAHTEEALKCAVCLAAPPTYDRARAAVMYDEVSRRLIVRFKHYDYTDYAPIFTQWMARPARKLITPNSVLVPVPLHKQRQFSRRFNQSAMLARLLAKQLDCADEPFALARVRATQPQQHLTKIEREKNVANAFAVQEAGAVLIKRGAHIILIDDVQTSGATLSAAASCLKRAGASQVDALVLARVVQRNAGAI